MECNQVMYTSAVTDAMRGYQIIAHSPGLNENELKEIERHSLPSRQILPEFSFSEATRYYALSTGKICVARMINVGRDHAGRPNRIYTHTIVLTMEQFKQLGCNPLVLDSLFVHDDYARGKIDYITIDTRHKSQPNVVGLTVEEIEYLISGILSDKRIVIIMDTVKDEKELISAIIMRLPAPIILKSTFSTFTLSPVDEDYKIMIVPKKAITFSIESLLPEFSVVDLSCHTSNNITKKTYARFVAENILAEDFETVKELNQFIEANDTYCSNIDSWYEYWFGMKKIATLPTEKSKADQCYTLGTRIKGISPTHALKNYQDALSLYKKIINLPSLVETYSRLIEIDKEGEMRWFEDGLQYIKSTKNEVLITNRLSVLKFANNFLAWIEGVKGFEQKIKYFDQLFGLYQSLNETNKSSEILNKKATMLLEVGEINKAVDYFRKSIEQGEYYREEILKRAESFINELKMREAYYHIIKLCRELIDHFQKTGINSDVLYMCLRKMRDANMNIRDIDKVGENSVIILNTLGRGGATPPQLKKEYEKLHEDIIEHWLTTIDSGSVEQIINHYPTIAKYSTTMYGELPRDVRRFLVSFTADLIKNNLQQELKKFIFDINKVVSRDDRKTLRIIEHMKDRAQKKAVRVKTKTKTRRFLFKRGRI